MVQFREIIPQPLIWSVRLVCSQWRALAASHIVALSTAGLSQQQYEAHNVSRVLQQFQHVRLLHQLPIKYFPSLPASLSSSLVTLTLTGTGSAALYEAHLPSLVMLRSCTFDGPVTMTDALLKALGGLPKLEHLAFLKLLFPRTPYQQCCFEKEMYQQLRRLEILNEAPLTSNGLGSGQAGQQFLLSLLHLQRVRLNMRGASQVLLEVLDKLPVLKFVELAYESRWCIEAPTWSHQPWCQWSEWQAGSKVQLVPGLCSVDSCCHRRFTAADVAP